MAEKCTKTSSPVERWINPYPFAPLNHFTVPFSLTENSFHCREELVPRISFIVAPANRNAPFGKTVELGCVHHCRGNCPKAKDSSSSTPREDIAARTSGAPDHRRCFYDPTQDVNLPYEPIARHTPGNEQPIISTSKSFDKKN